MADNDFPVYAVRWHERALETLELARNAGTEDRKRLLKVARAYERLAARAEEWSAVRESWQT